MFITQQKLRDFTIASPKLIIKSFTL